MLLNFKALKGDAPKYTCQLLENYSPARALQSSDFNSLVKPATNLCSMGDRAFRHMAPQLWNALPASQIKSNCICYMHQYNKCRPYHDTLTMYSPVAILLIVQQSYGLLLRNLLVLDMELGTACRVVAEKTVYDLGD